MAVLNPASTYFNTLAHLVVHTDQSASQEVLLKRAQRRYLLTQFAFRMIDLHSELEGSYWLTWWCCRTGEAGINTAGEIEQKHRYCKQRWCTICAGNRTAELIGAYKPALEQLKKPKFLTLTRRNVKNETLLSSIREMSATFSRILRTAQTAGLRSPGIRTLEVTYNSQRNDFHPHYHIVTDVACARHILREWMQRYGDNVVPAANILKPVDQNAYVEIFKYLTPVSYKPKGKRLDKSRQVVSPWALDAIYTALRGVRTIQPFGGLRRSDERLGNSGSILLNLIKTRWDDAVHDWVTDQGELLTGYEPSDQDKLFLDKLKDRHFLSKGRAK